MFRKLIKNKKAQNTAEYAILISLVVAGIIAMQTFAQRALQARIHDATVYMVNMSSGGKNNVPGLGDTLQYEPNYSRSEYSIARTDVDSQVFNGTGHNAEVLKKSDRTRNGFTVDAYNKVTLDQDSGTSPDLDASLFKGKNTNAVVDGLSDLEAPKNE